MIKLSPPANREEKIAYLAQVANENPEFTHMILPNGLIHDLPTKIGHMKVSESNHVEANKIILTIDVEQMPF